MDALGKHKLYEKLLLDKGEDAVLEDLVDSAADVMRAAIHVLREKRAQVDLRPSLDNLALKIGAMEISCEQGEELVGLEPVIDYKSKKLKSLETRAEFQRGDITL